MRFAMALADPLAPRHVEDCSYGAVAALFVRGRELLGQAENCVKLCCLLLFLVDFEILGIFSHSCFFWLDGVLYFHGCMFSETSNYTRSP